MAPISLLPDCPVSHKHIQEVETRKSTEKDVLVKYKNPEVHYRNLGEKQTTATKR